MVHSKNILLASLVILLFSIPLALASMIQYGLYGPIPTEFNVFCLYLLEFCKVWGLIVIVYVVSITLLLFFIELIKTYLFNKS